VTDLAPTLAAPPAAPRARLLPPEALARLENVALIARWAVEGFLQGLHRSPFHGFSVEFAEYRSYAPGEDLRHFDWKALAKSDRAYVKRYHAETNLHAHLLLDCSASMGYAGGAGAPSKLRYGACLAAALAHLLGRQQDAVGLALFAERLERYLAPRASPRHRRDILAVLEAARPRGGTRTAAALHGLAERIRGRGLVVLISDLYDDPDALLACLRHFRFRRHEVLVFHVLDATERALGVEGLTEFRDLESGERLEVLPAAYRTAYRAALEGFVGRWRKACADARIDYQLVDTATPFERALAAYLHRRSRLG
jgi:uncharacterized protein (DUF58 family)